jgi:hypothetical protein
MLVDSLRFTTRSYGMDLGKIYQRVAYGSMLSNGVGAVDNGVVVFQRGATLWPAFVWFVPRALWSGKPIMSIGSWYATTVLGWAPGSGETSPTLPGDFYLNFGLAGVLVGMFLYGLGMRLAYEYLVVRIGPPTGTWAFLPIFMVFGLAIEKNFSAIVGQAMQSLFSVLAIIWLLQRRGLPATATGR